MQYREIGGPYVPLYPEVVHQLEEIEGYAARWLYVAIITLFHIEEDWGSDADWIAGIIHTTKAEVMRQTRVGGKGKGGFWKAWDHLLREGLVVEQEDKSFRVPHFKKKRYDAISPREIREQIAGLKNEMEELREKLDESELERSEQAEESAPPGDQKPTSGRQKESSQRSKETSERTDQSSERTGDIIIDRKKKKTLSLIDIVNMFYIGIGQEKISRAKRERGVETSRKLIQDGFEPDDIQFAVEWTLKNPKGEIYDFSIIEHTIGQAMGARRIMESKMRDRQEWEDEQESRQEQEKESQEREEREREEIETFRESLSLDERVRLREEAQAEIAKSGDYKADFVSEILITAMENTILRARLEEKKGNGEMTPADSREDGRGE